VTFATIKIKGLWVPACAGMTVVAFIVFMFLYALFIVFLLHDNGLASLMNFFMGQQWY
jgi:hypothetical protein